MLQPGWFDYLWQCSRHQSKLPEDEGAEFQAKEQSASTSRCESAEQEGQAGEAAHASRF